MAQLAFGLSLGLIKKPLCEILPWIDIHHVDLQVKHLWRDNVWKLEELYTQLPHQWVQAILNVQPCLVDDFPDKWIWRFGINGTYTVGNAYHWVSNRDANSDQRGKWSWIWRLKIPANIQFFIWQICHFALLTSQCLNHWGVPLNPVCTVCNVEEETILHCLFACPRIMQVWQDLAIGIVPPSNTQELPNWLRKVVVTYGSLPFVVLWVIWLNHNRASFDHLTEPVTTVVAHALSLHQNIVQVWN